MRPAAAFAVAAVLAGGVAATAPGGAAAAVLCDYSQSGHFLEVRITSSFELAQVRRVGTTLQVRNAAAVSTCTSNPAGLTPSVTNTDVISITSDPGVRANTAIIEDAGGLAPGFTDEPGTDEIEVFVNLRDGESSLLSVRFGGFAVPMRFGANGINTDAYPFEDVPDVDVFPINVPRFDARGAFSTPVVLSAQGGAATGAAFAAALEIQGSTAADDLTGGEGPDHIQAFNGTDILRGAGGDDVLDPGEDADVVEGGPGTDTVDYLTRFYPSGVVVDLGRTTPQDTGVAGVDTLTGIENVLGTSFIDVLSGDGGPNRIEGFGGPDVIDGRGGADTVVAGAGADVIAARDGVADSIDCGPDTDTVTADVSGLDTLLGCENVDFAPTPPTPPVSPPAGTPPAGGGPVAGGAGTPAAPVLRALRLSPSPFTALAAGASVLPAARRTGGAVVSFTLDRAARVTFGVRRVVAGRRSGGRCAPLIPANRSSRLCTRLVTVRGTFARQSVAGANRVRISGRVRGRALPPGSYRLRASAAADGLAGVPVSVPFRIAS